MKNGGNDPLEDPEAISSSALFSRGQSLNGQPMSAFDPAAETPQDMSAGGGYEAFKLVTPLHVLLQREAIRNDEGLLANERELKERARLEAFSALLGEALAGANLNPASVGLNVIAWAWHLQRPEVRHLSQREIGEMVDQTRAAFCERHKRTTERKLERVGMHGTKGMKQKPASLVDVYRDKAKGNRNRAISAGKQRMGTAKRKRTGE